MYEKYAHEFYDQILTPMVKEICGWIAEDAEESEDVASYKAEKKELLAVYRKIDRDNFTFNLALTYDNDFTLTRFLKLMG